MCVSVTRAVTDHVLPWVNAFLGTAQVPVRGMGDAIYILPTFFSATQVASYGLQLVEQPPRVPICT